MGKSTLLADLAGQLRLRGRTVLATTLRKGCRRLPAGFLAAASSGPRTQLVIDGFEQLGWWHRWQVEACSWWRNSGLLVTTHRHCQLPVLAELAPDLRTVQNLVYDLLQGDRTVVTDNDVAASFARHNGNVREILFDLYDRYEQRTRVLRTSGVVST